jgi:hypothetical protein
MTTPAESLARARLVSTTSLGVAGAVLFMILYWVFSRSLEDIETVYAGGVLILLLAGIAWLAQRGKERLAAWLLVSLLTLIIATDLPYYGIGSPSAASFVIPIVLAACALGLWAGLGLAALSTAVIWIVAWGTTSGGWLEPPTPIDHLTFNAPALTVIFFLVAWIVGYWSNAMVIAHKTR